MAAKHNTFRSKHSATYTSWSGMLTRCYNRSNPKFPRYGGRGISVCPQWRSFKTFLADMGERPPGKTLDRYPNNDGNYEPGNCRWATVQQQSRNTSQNLRLTYNGETLTLSDWADRVGMRRESIWARMKIGLPIDMVLHHGRLKLGPNPNRQPLDHGELHTTVLDALDQKSKIQ